MGANFFQNRCNIGLNHISHCAGWLGIAFRLLASILLIVLLSGFSKDDPQLYKIACGILLSYFLVSFVPNICFIFGIIKVLRHFMLGYIIVVAVELSLCFVILMGASTLLIGLGGMQYGLILGTLSLIFIGVNYSLWICCLILYKEMKLGRELAQADFSDTRINLNRFNFPQSNNIVI